MLNFIQYCWMFFRLFEISVYHWKIWDLWISRKKCLVSTANYQEEWSSNHRLAGGCEWTGRWGRGCRRSNYRGPLLAWLPRDVCARWKSYHTAHKRNKFNKVSREHFEWGGLPDWGGQFQRWRIPWGLSHSCLITLWDRWGNQVRLCTAVDKSASGFCYVVEPG